MADTTQTPTTDAPVSNTVETPSASSSRLDNVRLFSAHYPILLRTPEEKDATEVHQITSDSNIYDHNNWLARRASISEADALQRIEKMRGYAAMTPPARIELVVVLLSAPGADEEGSIIGLSGIREFSERPGKKIAEVGASIIAAHKDNKEFYAECLRLSIDFALERAGANAIQVMIHENSADKLEIMKDSFGWKRGAIDGQGKYRRYDADKLRWVETKEHIAKTERKGAEGLGSSLGRKFNRFLGKGN